jgi:hypothetical protein
MRQIQSKKTGSSRLGLMLILLSLAVIGASTFAWFTYRLNGTSTLNFGKIQISSASDKTHIVLSKTLNNVVPGDNLLDSTEKVHFKVDSNSEALYVRVRFYFDTTEDAVKPYVEELNSMQKTDWGITTGASGYDWSERDSHNFYYLVVKNASNVVTNDMYNITKDNINADTDFVFATQLIVPTDVKQILSNNELVQYNKSITCNFAIDAVQSANYVGEVDGTSANVTNLTYTFNDKFNPLWANSYKFLDNNGNVVNKTLGGKAFTIPQTYYPTVTEVNSKPFQGWKISTDLSTTPTLYGVGDTINFSGTTLFTPIYTNDPSGYTFAESQNNSNTYAITSMNENVASNPYTLTSSEINGEIVATPMATTLETLTLPRVYHGKVVSEIINTSSSIQINATTLVIPSSMKTFSADAFSNSTISVVDYLGTLENWCSISFNNVNSTPMSKANTITINNVNINVLEIPSVITELKDYSFYGFKNLDYVYLPSTLTKIGNSVFESCNYSCKIYSQNKLTISGDCFSNSANGFEDSNSYHDYYYSNGTELYFYDGYSKAEFESVSNNTNKVIIKDNTGRIVGNAFAHAYVELSENAMPSVDNLENSSGDYFQGWKIADSSGNPSGDKIYKPYDIVKFDSVETLVPFYSKDDSSLSGFVSTTITNKFNNETNSCYISDSETLTGEVTIPTIIKGKLVKDFAVNSICTSSFDFTYFSNITKLILPRSIKNVNYKDNFFGYGEQNTGEIELPYINLKSVYSYSDTNQFYNYNIYSSHSGYFYNDKESYSEDYKPNVSYENFKKLIAPGGLLEKSGIKAKITTPDLLRDNDGYILDQNGNKIYDSDDQESRNPIKNFNPNDSYYDENGDIFSCDNLKDGNEIIIYDNINGSGDTGKYDINNYYCFQFNAELYWNAPILEGSSEIKTPKDLYGALGIDYVFSNGRVINYYGNSTSPTFNLPDLSQYGYYYTHHIFDE